MPNSIRAATDKSPADVPNDIKNWLQIEKWGTTQNPHTYTYIHTSKLTRKKERELKNVEFTSSLLLRIERQRAKTFTRMHTDDDHHSKACKQSERHAEAKQQAPHSQHTERKERRRSQRELEFTTRALHSLITVYTRSVQAAEEAQAAQECFQPALGS